jgi:hypothetical protein
VFAHGSDRRLTPHDLERFAGPSLFDRIGRVVCSAGCLPRKELYEAWEVARRVRRRFRGGRVVDLAAGHGLLAHLMLLLDDSSPAALAVDKTLPPSSSALQEVLVAEWPRLSGRVSLVEAAVDGVEIGDSDIVVSSHACGRLTDVILDRAVSARARVAVLPCCQDFAACDTGDLSGWLEPALAIDVMRAVRVRRHRYRIWTQTIAAGITPKDRLLLAQPLDARSSAVSETPSP